MHQKGYVRVLQAHAKGLLRSWLELISTQPAAFSRSHTASGETLVLSPKTSTLIQKEVHFICVGVGALRTSTKPCLSLRGQQIPARARGRRYRMPSDYAKPMPRQILQQTQSTEKSPRRC